MTSANMDFFLFLRLHFSHARGEGAALIRLCFRRICTHTDTYSLFNTDTGRHAHRFLLLHTFALFRAGLLQASTEVRKVPQLGLGVHRRIRGRHLCCAVAWCMVKQPPRESCCSWYWRQLRAGNTCFGFCLLAYVSLLAFLTAALAHALDTFVSLLRCF